LFSFTNKLLSTSKQVFSMRNQVALLLMLVLLASCLINAKPVSSQTSPETPQFTLKLEDDSQDIVNASGTFHIEIKFVDVVINNTVPYSMYAVVNDTIVKPYYNVHVKGHSQDWKDATISLNLAPQNGNTTVKFGLGGTNPDPGGWSIWLGSITNESQIDFQVRAINGFYTHTGDVGPICWRNPGFSSFNETGRSNWSDTQTLTLPNGSASTSPTPTGVLSLSGLLLPLSIVLGAVMIAVLVGALIFAGKHRKTRGPSDPLAHI
jgi:hypothetical protein